ncbi:MAG: hydrogenase formation protein HypD [Thermoplasmata archaeon]|nr:hydrogenase formation protein HypD [Thermoplasmata archaeon]
MKFELRDKELAADILERIGSSGIKAQFMHVCGTHQDTLVRNGLDTMLAQTGIRIIQGPGCPVCVTTPKEIEETLKLAESGITITVFGDMLTVPGDKRSLADVKAGGGDVRVVYSITDALKMARQEPDKEFVFMGIGFETTTPSTSLALLSRPPENFSIISCHRTVPKALKALVNMGEVKIDGLIEPGHVSTIIGEEPYRFLSEEYKIPQVIAGFEPVDLLMGIYMLTRQLAEGRAELENEYSRVVKPEGNPKAREAMAKTLVETDVKWRGFPVIPETGLEISDKFDAHNARKKHEDLLAPIWDMEFPEPEGCKCGEILRGITEPQDCPLFGKACKPGSPVGPCMVSFEGGCAIAYKYQRK